MCCMVKLKKVKTESPATTLGVLSFALETEAPKIRPRDFFLVLGAFVLLELALIVFFPV